MIKEIIGDDFMDCQKVKKICMSRGISQKEIRKHKLMEGIGTLTVTNEDGEQMWLWFDPLKIWEKYK